MQQLPKGVPVHFYVSAALYHGTSVFPCAAADDDVATDGCECWAGAGGESLAPEMKTTATPSMLWCQWLRLNLQMCQIPKVKLCVVCRVSCRALTTSAPPGHTSVPIADGRQPQ
jgi:hypothetical protein